MAVTTIKELRILPPLAIGRFGSSPDPLENYTLEITDPMDFRKIVPAPTLMVGDDGAIARETTPDPKKDKVRFRDDQGRVKPLAPFLEVWARFEDGGELQPLTKAHLTDLGLAPADVEWSVQAANLKVFRRTGDRNDMVQARVEITRTDGGTLHQPRSLTGNCRNFKQGQAGQKTIPLGSVHYVRPTDAFPEIRFRFTPGAGFVYGTRAGDPLIRDDVYAGVTALPAPPNGPWSPPFAGTWDRYWIGAPNSPPVTAPGDIFQGQFVGNTKVSDGYFDDSCDGIVQVRLRVGATTLTAYARFMSGVPDFAPDSYHARTISDDLEQMAFGPDVARPATPQDDARLKEEVVDTIRRAYETVRLMNTSVQNGDQNIADVARNRNNMPGQQSSYGRRFEPIFDTASGAAEYGNALSVHRSVLRRALDSTSLAGSFRDLSVVRPYSEVGDLRTMQRRRMPAMMRGSDGLEFALTRRQYAKLALAAEGQRPATALAMAHVEADIAPPPAPPVMPARRLPPRVQSLPNVPE